MKLIPLLLTLSALLVFNPDVWAQGRGNDKKEYKYDKDKKEKEKEDKERYKDDDRYKKRKDERRKGKEGEVLGRVVFPPVGVPGPRRLEGVPRGHYPPPGECRIWYPNRPPGHQPPPTDCRRLVRVRLEPGAFILHGDRAYDAAYDWREEDRRRPGSVGRDILDILFPRR